MAMRKDETTITIRFPREVYDKVAALAQKAHRSLTGEAVWLVTTSLAAEERRISVALAISLERSEVNLP